MKQTRRLILVLIAVSSGLLGGAFAQTAQVRVVQLLPDGVRVDWSINGVLRATTSTFGASEDWLFAYGEAIEVSASVDGGEQVSTNLKVRQGRTRFVGYLHPATGGAPALVTGVGAEAPPAGESVLFRTVNLVPGLEDVAAVDSDDCSGRRVEAADYGSVLPYLALGQAYGGPISICSSRRVLAEMPAPAEAESQLLPSGSVRSLVLVRHEGSTVVEVVDETP